MNAVEKAKALVADYEREKEVYEKVAKFNRWIQEHKAEGIRIVCNNNKDHAEGGSSERLVVMAEDLQPDALDIIGDLMIHAEAFHKDQLEEMEGVEETERTLEQPAVMPASPTPGDDKGTGPAPDNF